MTTKIQTFASYCEIKDLVHVPSIQRDLLEDHVEAMRIHINERRERNKQPIFGAIDLVKLNNVLFVVDGQHRLEAIRREHQSLKPAIQFHCIVYEADSTEELREIFVTRNKG